MRFRCTGMTCDPDRNPLLAAPAIDPGAARIALTLPVRMTVGDIVAAAFPGREPAMRARPGGFGQRAKIRIAHPERWHSVKPREGGRMVIRLVHGENALRAALSIMLAVAADAIGSPGAGAMFL